MRIQIGTAGGDILATLDALAASTPTGVVVEDLGVTATYGTLYAPAEFTVFFGGSGLTMAGGFFTGGTLTAMQVWDGELSMVRFDQFAESALNATIASTLQGFDFSGTDEFVGTAGNDLLQPAIGNDLVRARAGDDIIVGGQGHDVIDGGIGIDTSLYSGPRSRYQITFDDATKEWTVQDKGFVSPDGTDTLGDIERLAFTDMTLSLVAPPRASAPDYGKSTGFLLDPVYYLLQNSELVPTLTMENAAAHYASVGAAQGRAPNAWFDAAWYEARWPDLAPLGLDDATLFAHYNLYGVWEGRAPGPAFATFDGGRYLFNNPDVALYVDANIGDFLGSRTNGAIAHFIIYGHDEQRLAFDTGGQAIELGYVA